MRERLAKAYAVALAVLVTGLAALFAERQNAPGAVPGPSADGMSGQAAPRVPAQDAPADPEAVSRGRDVFVAQGCLRCHRVAGEGSPRSPLDGVGGRLFPDELRAWVVGDDAVRGGLSPSVARIKADYRDMPDGDLEALVTYLGALRGGG